MEIMSLDPKPKRIHVFVNGFPTERIFFVHPKCRLSWMSIINTIAELLKPQNASVRVLRRIDGRAVSSYEELEDNGKYVACGREPMVYPVGGYRTESEMELQKELEPSSSKLTNTVANNTKCMDDPEEIEIITIYVFVNGQKTKPHKITLLNDDLDHWTSLCNIISKQLNEPVKYLYTIFGTRLKKPSEVQNKGFYVALPEGSSFKDISYISVFSPKRQRKVRFKQTTQQTTLVEGTVSAKDMSAPNEAEVKEVPSKSNKSLNELIPSIQDKVQLVRNCEVIDLNNSSLESPCIHLTIVQKPLTVMDRLGVSPKGCASKANAKLILEMISENDDRPAYHICQGTQTSSIFCEAFPKGKCSIEVCSRKFHIISDDDAIVLPCGTYFSSHRALTKPCTFPIGNDMSFENIAQHIVGIVLDTSEYCISRALYGLDKPILKDVDRQPEETAKKESKTILNSLPIDLNNVSDDIVLQKQRELYT